MAKRIGRWAVRALLATLALVGTAVGWNFATGNRATVLPGRVYRSAQLRAGDLAREIRRHRIRTVLNLRGQNPDQPWYRAERDATLDAAATQVDLALSSCVWMSRTQLRTLLDAIETSETPILIHCSRGAERTGLASALAVLLREGSTLAEARAQFSIRYLFVEAGDGVVTLRHLDQYEGWLGRLGLAHSPATLRRWVDEGYTPGTPGRDDWPFDPYPLIVVTRPTPAGPVERKVWDPRGRPEAARATVGANGPEIR